MKRVKLWFYNKFLPDYARADCNNTIEKLYTKIEKQEQEIRELNAYIAGFELGQRTSVVVRNEVVR